MLTPFDDYPVHQTPEPIAKPASGDRNAYDRYFFNGYRHDAELYFAAAWGLYPNRSVQDAAFSVVRGGEQISIHASRRAPTDRVDMTVGPITVEVVRNKLEGIAGEMQQTLLRSSFSPIVKEGLDAATHSFEDAKAGAPEGAAAEPRRAASGS